MSFRLDTTYDWNNWMEATIRIKIYRSMDKKKNYMEFRYALQPSDKGPGALKWSLSDEKGAFKKEFVKISPWPQSFMAGDCVVYRCGRNQDRCSNNQQRAVETFHTCPIQPETTWLDICEPEHLWNSRRGKGRLATGHC
ncbi:hypothetical protein DL95DRAFT_505655 [Leptodontidium sp. 2 PMI_412]|nr:hypothetical protein DL95DRAFT_505655 [Leptodontidium sp. 2 PMI_412]